MALLPAWLPLPTAVQTVELFAAVSVVLGLYFIVTKTKQIKWNDMLVAIGVFFVPAVIIMGLEGFLTPISSGLILGTMIAYIMAKLDTD